ncbi:D-hexose-6-phosphate mutarotase [Pseudomonas mangiferae]|uniref:Putative glucose-6-phosphate 1-epimerase n=1 Tax=Pseudomonas mangiferae TaxID=2593654 RepID=A0A553GVB7_9PSED|nr:D-hexose-6-phosphate mutarotase [Pseudomonas mangiferae]TRX73431.1 D-hexose-6-phosphate mutarotase [Pseudomonas mangiferae]
MPFANASGAQVERLQRDELTCWRVRQGGAELLVAQQGAQVLAYGRVDQPPLIWLSEDAAFRRGQSVRGGVPVCWPWFGDLRRNPEAVQAAYASEDAAPAHGLVRGLDWQLEDVEQQDGAVTLHFTLDTRAEPLPHWPQAVQPSLRIRLDERLHLHLENHNLGPRPVTVSQALHTYFAVSDIHRVRVEGLAGARYLDTLRDWRPETQAGALAFEGETDRLYLDVPPRLSLVDEGWGRRVQVESLDSRSAILWNPWIDKGARLSQFADDAWQRMLCIETARVLDDVLVLAPGERHRMGVSLWSEPL